MTCTRNWRLIIHSKHDPYMNMAVDETLLESVMEGRSNPVLRFYEWEKPTVSVGYFQKTQELNLKNIVKHNLGFVRRPTGGQAVLHDKELTYSVTMNINNEKSLTDIFKKINSSLIYGLRSFGINAEMFEKKNKEMLIQKNNLSNKSICFTSPSNYEIRVNSKKLLGSALMKRKYTIMQHGSLLFKYDPYILFDIFNFKTDLKKETAVNLFNTTMTCINEEIRNKIKPSDLYKPLSEGFKSNFGAIFVNDSLDKYEKIISEKLYKEKYSCNKWNFMR